MDDDRELLRRFADEGAAEALAEFVRRKVNLVYATALRLTGGDTHLAEEVTQGVFVALACEAKQVARHAVPTGWLFTTTRFVANKARRAQRRWQRREQEAHAMNQMNAGAEVAWTDVRPLIDEALHELSEADRDAIVLRYFEGRSLAEVGAAIGLGENSARMRVERALEKLRARLAKRGITSTAVALGAVLAGQPAVAAPTGFAAKIAAAALLTKPAAAAGGGIIFMGTKLKMAVAAALVVAGAGSWWVVQQRWTATQDGLAAVNEAQARELAALKGENRRLAEEQRRMSEAAAAQAAPGGTASGEMGGLSRLRMIAALQQRQVLRTGLTVITVEREIDPTWAEIFGLSPKEKAALESAMAAATAEIGVQELGHATVARKAPNTLVIVVEPFPEGAAIYDRLTQRFAEVLGPERYAAFATLGMADLEERLQGLGATRRTLTLTYDPAPKDAARAWGLSTDMDRLDGTRKLGVASGPTLNGIVSFYLGPLAKLVPADFGQ